MAIENRWRRWTAICMFAAIVSGRMACASQAQATDGANHSAFAEIALGNCPHPPELWLNIPSATSQENWPVIQTSSHESIGEPVLVDPLSKQAIPVDFRESPTAGETAPREVAQEEPVDLTSFRQEPVEVPALRLPKPAPAAKRNSLSKSRKRSGKPHRTTAGSSYVPRACCCGRAN